MTYYGLPAFAVHLIRMYGFVEMSTQYEGYLKCKVHYHVIIEQLIGVTLENVVNGVIISSILDLYNYILI